MKKNKNIKINSILLSSILAINSSLLLVPKYTFAKELVSSEEMEQIEALCSNFLSYPPTEKTQSMLELADILKQRHKGKDLGDLNAVLKEEEKIILKDYSSGFEFIDDFQLESFESSTPQTAPNGLSNSLYHYSNGGKKSNNIFNGLTSQKSSGSTSFADGYDYKKVPEFKIDAKTIDFFNSQYTKEQKRKDYLLSNSFYKKERELLDKISNQYLINNKEKRLNTSWVDFAKDNKELVDNTFKATSPEQRSILQDELLNKCKKKLAFDSATNIEDRSSAEDYELVLKSYEKLFGNKKPDEPNSIVTTSPTCVEGEDSNMMLIDSNGRRITCDKLADSPLKENDTLGGLLTIMELPSQQILKRYGTQEYCETCLKNKYDFYSKFNSKLNKTKDSNFNPQRQKEKWDNKIEESKKNLNKELQLKAISNSILKLSDLSEQYQHSLAWMDEEAQEKFQKNQKPCVTEQSIEKAISSSNQCNGNKYKLESDDILKSISFSLGTQLGSFGEVESEIQKIMKKSLKASEDVQCKNLSREEFVRRSAAVNFQTNATKGAEYIINQMLKVASSDIDSYRKNNSSESAMTPIQFLTNVLSNEVLKDEIQHVDPLKRSDRSNDSTTPLTDFFRASRSGLNFSLQDVLKDLPQLSNFAKDRALTNTLATSQSQKPARNKIMIQASLTAYLSKVARTNPQLYFLLNDKDYFLDKADKYKKSNSNREFTDFISNNGNKDQHMKTLADDYAKYQDNKCQVFMKEIAEAACPSDKYHDRFSNKDKKLAANSLAKKEDAKRADNRFSLFFRKNKISEKEYYLNMIALESAACSETLSEGLSINKLKDSPLLDIDYSIAPTSKSDYQDILKEKLGLGKVKKPKNKLNEFAQTKLCDVKPLDKVFDNYALNSQNVKRLNAKEMDEIASAFHAEESRVKKYNEVARKSLEKTASAITENTIFGAKEAVKENLSEERNKETDRIVSNFSINTSPLGDSYSSDNMSDDNMFAFNPNTSFQLPTMEEALNSMNGYKSSPTFSYQFKDQNLKDLQDQFRENDKTIAALKTNFTVPALEKPLLDQTEEMNTTMIADKSITEFQAQELSPIEATSLSDTPKGYISESNDSLLSSSVTQSLTSGALSDLQSGDMESYNNRVSYQDPMYREMLNETSLQHPKNIEQEKIEYDEYLNQKEDNPSELKSEVDKLMAEIEDLKTKKNEDKLAQLKAQKKAIEQELLTAQEEKLESEIKQKSAQVAQAVAANNTSIKKSPIVKTNTTTNTQSSGQSYNTPVAANTNSYNNTASYSSNTPQVQKTRNTPSSNRAPASIKRNGKKSILSSQSSSGPSKSIASSFNPIGILSSDGKTVDNGALDTYLNRIKEQDITDQSQLVHFENINGNTVVKFSNTDGTNIEVDLSQIEDQDVLTELYQIQTNLEFSEKEIISALEKQKKLVEKNDVVISEIIKTNEEKARLELLKEKLKLASQAYKAATN